jgi:hypothetical protein
MFKDPICNMLVDEKKQNSSVMSTIKQFIFAPHHAKKNSNKIHKTMATDFVTWFFIFIKNDVTFLILQL